MSVIISSWISLQSMLCFGRFVVKGYVSYVVNINQFYVQRSEDIGKIEQLQQEINNTYEVGQIICKNHVST